MSDDDVIADDVRTLANRWAFKFTLLAQWVKDNCTEDQAREAQEYVSAGTVPELRKP